MKKCVKHCLYVFAVFLLLLIGSLFLLPAFLSTTWGKTFLIHRIESNYKGNYQIQTLQCTWFGSQIATGIQIHQGNTSASIKTMTLTTPLYNLLFLRKKPIDLMFLGNLEIQEAEISLQENAKITNLSLQTNNQQKKLLITGNAKSKSPETGTFKIQGVHFTSWNWQANLDKIPAQFFACFGQKNDYDAILGRTFSSEISLNDLALQCSFSSPKLFVQAQGALLEGVFKLTSSMTVHYFLDTLASQALFQHLSFKPVSSKKITCTIYPEKAQFTYRPFSINSLNIEKMELNLGEMMFRNFGALSDLLSIIQLNIRLNDNVPIWFQQAPISIHKGVALFQRTEMLIDRNYELGFFGALDFAKKIIDGNFILTSQILKKVFLLQSIPQHYSILMPVDGPLTQPIIHKSKALRDIARILIAEKANLPLHPKPSKNVPPARYPLPWSQ